MNDPRLDPERGGAARNRARKPTGVARVRQPLKDAKTRLWRARYVDLDGVVRQHGRSRPRPRAYTPTRLGEHRKAALAELTALVRGTAR